MDPIIQSNILGAYVIMILGLIGIISVVLYIVISILLYYRKKKKSRTE